jgi:hypothetical protein
LAPECETLSVLPILNDDAPQCGKQVPRSGAPTSDKAVKEADRVNKELAELKANADFPVEFLPLQICTQAGEAQESENFATAEAPCITELEKASSTCPLKKRSAALCH